MPAGLPKFLIDLAISRRGAAGAISPNVLMDLDARLVRDQRGILVGLPDEDDSNSDAPYSQKS